MVEPPIFILGSDRSGTTLLRLMLIQSPVLHIPAESGFLTVLRDQQKLYGDFTQPYQRWFFIRDLQTNKATSKTFTFPIFKLTLAEAEAVLVEAAPTDFPGAAAALFTASAGKINKQRWGDKTPRQVLDIPWLAGAFPGAKFVHIVRDGRDVAVSIRKAGWVSNMIKAAHYWQERVEAGRTAGASLGKNRYCELFFEQLVMHPEETLRDLCSWLELEYVPEMLHYYQNADAHIPEEHAHLFELAGKAVDASRAYAWKRTLSRCEIADFESVAGGLLQKLGYEVANLTVPLQVRGVRFLKKALRPLLREGREIVSRIG